MAEDEQRLAEFAAHGRFRAGDRISGGEVLPGGTANQGRIRRHGDTVWRPRLPGATARHALLRHLADVGFDGAPRVRTLDSDTEVLSYLPGETAEPPLPAWAVTDAALASVGALLRGLHDATRGFDPRGWTWPGRVPLAYRADIVSHNDPHPGNLVFADGVAVGLIDFDLAEPGSRAWDLAHAACFWVPMLDPVDVRDARVGQAGHRLAVLFEGYGAGVGLRAETVDALVDAHDWIYEIIRAGAEAGHPGFARSWREQRAAASRARPWIEQRRLHLLDAVRPAARGRSPGW